MFGSTGPASQNIVFWSASIGRRARSPLTRPATRRFKVRTGRKRTQCLNHGAQLSAEKLKGPGGIQFPFIRRRRDFARGDFQDENRELMVQEVPSARSRLGGILAEGSPQGRIGMGTTYHPGH